VLLNWNGENLTVPCIESLLAGEQAPWRILVFDNGSTDGSPERIAQRFPEPGVHVIRSAENLGFTGGNNAGARWLVENGADLVWVLNNDTVVDRRCLAVLTRAMEEDPSVAASTAKILFENPRNRIWYAGAWWRPWSMTAPHRGLLEEDHGQYDQPADVGFLSGCCMLIRSEVVQRIGLFSERYFIYNEDSEWSIRAVRAGLRLRYVPAAVLWHRISATMSKGALSAGKASPRAEYLLARNTLFTIREHARRPWQLLTAVACFSVPRLMRASGLLAYGRRESSRAILRGLWHGLSGRPR
jgi:GT2 family glycosyltransferase